MKTKNRNIFFLIFIVVISVLLNSCWKEFDANSYAPVFKIGGYARASEVAKENCVGYWAFEGSVYDSISLQSGIGVNSTYTKGFVGQAYNGGNNAYAYCGISDALKQLNGSFTVNLCMKYNASGIAATASNWVHYLGLIPENATGTWGPKFQFMQYPTSSATSWHFASNVKNARIGNTFWGSNLWTSVDKFKDKWVNWSFVYDATTSTYNIYMDGAQWKSDGWVDSNTGWGGNTYPQTNSAWENLQFGAISKIVFGAMNEAGLEATGDWGKNPAFFDGALDEVRIYNTALTQKQISTLISLMSKGM